MRSLGMMTYVRMGRMHLTIRGCTRSHAAPAQGRRGGVRQKGHGMSQSQPPV